MASNFTEQYGIVSIPDEIVADLEMVMRIADTHSIDAAPVVERLQTFLKELKAQNNE